MITTHNFSINKETLEIKKCFECNDCSLCRAYADYICCSSIEEAQEEMENLKEAQREFEEMLRELEVERIEQEQEQQEEEELCLIEQADEYMLQYEQIDCSCSKCKQIEEEIYSLELLTNFEITEKGEF